MKSNELSKQISIREVSAEELNAVLKVHFNSTFSNRADAAPSVNLPEETKGQISDRAKADARFKLRLLIYQNSQVVGWHTGQATDPETYYMQNSAILAPFRGQGLYKVLMNYVLGKVKSEGFQVVTSTHHPNNPAVLIPKLKAGFVISGMQLHERFRFLIELKYFVSEERRKAYDKNIGLEL